MAVGIVKPRIERQVQEEWTGLVAIYLFLGGVGAGAYTVAGAATLLGAGWEHVANAGLYLSFPLVCIGLLFLLAHLGSPMKSFLAGSKIGTSWISRGVFIFTIFIILSVIHFYLQVISGEWEIPAILPIAGMLFGLFTMLYTGALLSGAKGYPFWQSAALPVLFLTSGLVTGLFAVIITMAIIDSSLINGAQLRQMAGVGGALVVVELLIIFFFLHSASRVRNSRESAQRLLKKSSFVFFDLILGLFVPLIILFVVYFGMVESDASAITNAAVVAAVLGLIGGFLLRYGILTVGMQTSLDMAGFQFRPIARLDFERSQPGRMPPS